MNLSFASLKSNHYTSDIYRSDYVSGDTLYSELGYDQKALIKQNSGYQNTCATRMSLALIKSGVTIHGRLKIKGGTHKGQLFEPGAKLLADQLARPQVLGKPQVFKAADAPAKLAGKKGIVFFWKIDGYGGGHIDVIETTNGTQVCNSACYFSSKEIWFWPLD
ncbi:T6SS effector amidase Tae4 family protein [Azonexus sp.]|uniref:T6SS effector amidase Tae4 family protein n=1 Tax=Azonexus sp. TaxID=1872668 RepID=UPI0035B2F669